jgi:hypothetical protein
MSDELHGGQLGRGAGHSAKKINQIFQYKTGPMTPFLPSPAPGQKEEALWQLMDLIPV